MPRKSIKHKKVKRRKTHKRKGKRVGRETRCKKTRQYRDKTQCVDPNWPCYDKKQRACYNIDGTVQYFNPVDDLMHGLATVTRGVFNTIDKLTTGRVRETREQAEKIHEKMQGLPFALDMNVKKQPFIPAGQQWRANRLVQDAAWYNQMAENYVDTVVEGAKKGAKKMKKCLNCGRQRRRRSRSGSRNRSGSQRRNRSGRRSGRHGRSTTKKRVKFRR